MTLPLSGQDSLNALLRIRRWWSWSCSLVVQSVAQFGKRISGEGSKIRVQCKSAYSGAEPTGLEPVRSKKEGEFVAMQVPHGERILSAAPTKARMNPVWGNSTSVLESSEPLEEMPSFPSTGKHFNEHSSKF